MQVNDRLGDIQRQICLLSDVNDHKVQYKLEKTDQRTWKDVDRALREGSGEASIAASRCG